MQLAPSAVPLGTKHAELQETPAQVESPGLAARAGCGCTHACTCARVSLQAELPELDVMRSLLHTDCGTVCVSAPSLSGSGIFPPSEECSLHQVSLSVLAPPGQHSQSIRALHLRSENLGQKQPRRCS